MANTLANVIPQMIAQTLMAMRENAQWSRTVRRDLDANAAAEKGDTIDITVPSAIAVRDVVTNTSGDIVNQDVTPTKVQLRLDKWKEATFHMDDKSEAEVINGHLPSQASEALKSVINQIEADGLGLFTEVGNHAGTAGTTPFASSTAEARAAKLRLNVSLAPMGDRFGMIDPDAEDQATAVANFVQAEQAGNAQTITEGTVGRKLGIEWIMNQNVTAATAQAASTLSTAPTDFSAAGAVGDLTVSLDATTLTGSTAVGEVFSFVGSNGVTYQHAITSVVAAAGNDLVAVGVTPALQIVVADNTAITYIVDAHMNNLVYNRGAFALAMRQLRPQHAGSDIILPITDPVSGLTIRLCVVRGYKSTTWSYDALYGVKTIRPEYACRLFG